MVGYANAHKLAMVGYANAHKLAMVGYANAHKLAMVVFDHSLHSCRTASQTTSGIR